jgi:hypothetical protein
VKIAGAYSVSAMLLTTLRPPRGFTFKFKSKFKYTLARYYEDSGRTFFTSRWMPSCANSLVG